MWVVYLILFTNHLFSCGRVAEERARGLRFRHASFQNPEAGGLGRVTSCLKPQSPHL